MPYFERRVQLVIFVNFSDLKQSDIAKGLNFNPQKVSNQYTKQFFSKISFCAKNCHFIYLPWLKSALYGPGAIFVSGPCILVVPGVTLNYTRKFAEGLSRNATQIVHFKCYFFC